LCYCPFLVFGVFFGFVKSDQNVKVPPTFSEKQPKRKGGPLRFDQIQQKQKVSRPKGPKNLKTLVCLVFPSVPLFVFLLAFWCLVCSSACVKSDQNIKVTPYVCLKNNQNVRRNLYVLIRFNKNRRFQF